MPLAPGTPIGDFRILREIGRGAMGEVYLAEQPRLHRSVALKILNPGLASDPGLLERFRREALHAAKLRHGAIVSVFDAGEHEGTLYIAMDFIEGRSLDRIVREMRERGAKPGPELLASFVRIGIEMASALHYAHEEGMLHRDIKPSNILLDRRGRPYLSDFGLARHRFDSPLTISGDLVGTPKYMAPELLDKTVGPVDRRVDVYSLGATLYELLTLEAPFEGEGLQGLFARIKEGHPMPASERNAVVPEALAQALHRALSRDPAERFSTAREFAEALQLALNEAFADFPGDVSFAALLGSMRAEHVETPRPQTPKKPGSSSVSRHEASRWLHHLSANPKWILLFVLCFAWIWIVSVEGGGRGIPREMSFGAYPLAFFVLITLEEGIFRKKKRFWLWVYRVAAFLTCAGAIGVFKAPAALEWVYTGLFLVAHLLFDRWVHRGEMVYLHVAAIPWLLNAILSSAVSEHAFRTGSLNLVGPAAIFSLSSALVLLPAYFSPELPKPSAKLFLRTFSIGLPAAALYFSIRFFFDAAR